MRRLELSFPRNADAILVGAFAAIVGSAVGSGAIGANRGTDPTTPRTYLASGFQLDDSPKAAAAFPGNEIVVLAEIEEALPATWNTDLRDGGNFSFIFTPLRITVKEILRGEPRLLNDTMLIRRLGGRVGDDELIVSDDVVPPGLVPGNQVLLFLGEQRTIARMDAATPNMAYVVDANGVAHGSRGVSIDLAVFRSLIVQANPQ